MAIHAAPVLKRVNISKSFGSFKVDFNIAISDAYMNLGDITQVRMNQVLVDVQLDGIQL